jgi:[acyl-carrier-protein] S-malonyltransferase
MKIGFLFPGQGSQSLGMGKDLYDKYDAIKKLYNEVEKITGIDVAHITFEDEEKLNQTQYTQICLLTMSLAILEILKENNINAEISSGLSLGEYSALIYSKALSFEDGISLVKNRGEYMQKLAPSGDWKMAAILGLEDKQVEEVCNKVTKGFARAVNFNCPGQVAISGDVQGIEEAEIIAKEMGAKKVRVLNTSGPFHTEKLKEASIALRNDLENVKINEFQSKVVRNLDGEIYTSSDNIKDILANHIINPVRFTKGLEKMLSEGVDTFIEIGAGKTLSGFVKRMPTEKEINILNINNVESLEKTLEFLKKENS